MSDDTPSSRTWSLNSIRGRGVILGGLPEEYKNVVDQIEGKDTAPNITEIHERLLNHEAKLLATKEQATEVAPVSANMVQNRNQNNNFNTNRNNNGGSYNNYNNTRRNNNNGDANRQYRSDTRTFKPYLGKCQLCNTQGHSARRCPQF